ncbi:hypothetical protein KP509_10G088700 [Ceratopteris richardii]|uniref:Uncharacterized protein n=1 Tax=Ceratopteris richardii TaxID=49495 RepID=A0A8T2TX89_CERRI|nr:hypothetical protein KP509_10G088700 [Ceratopteris richardii]
MLYPHSPRTVDAMNRGTLKTPPYHRQHNRTGDPLQISEWTDLEDALVDMDYVTCLFAIMMPMELTILRTHALVSAKASSSSLTIRGFFLTRSCEELDKSHKTPSLRHCCRC